MNDYFKKLEKDYEEFQIINKNIQAIQGLIFSNSSNADEYENFMTDLLNVLSVFIENILIDEQEKNILSSFNSNVEINRKRMKS